MAMDSIINGSEEKFRSGFSWNEKIYWVQFFSQFQSLTITFSEVFKLGAVQ